MQFAEVGEECLGTEPQHARAAGVIPGWRITGDLRFVSIEPAGGEHGHDIGFDVERIGRIRAVAPVAAGPAELGCTRADAA